MTVVPVAVGDQDGVTVLRDNRHHGGLSRLRSLGIRSEHEAFWGDARDVEVPLVTLDSYVDANPGTKPTFIKLDVEGAGHWVMRGARRTIERDRPLVSCSFHSPEERSGVLEVLGQHGYRGVYVDNRGLCTWRELAAASANFVHPEDPRIRSWRMATT